MNPEFMREALDLARKGRSLASPNPMVGAVLVRDGEVVGRGFHTYAGIASCRDHCAGRRLAIAHAAPLSTSIWNPARTTAARRLAPAR